MEQPQTTPQQRLFSIKDNPAPPDSVVGQVNTPDGVKLRFARWKTTNSPSKGTIIVLHGRSENIEKYFEIITDLRDRGFDVLTFDWRGQGGSDRQLRDPMKGHVENFDQYLVDLDTILTEVALPDCKPPHFILAHSTGGLVALLGAPALTNRIHRMVLCSPLLGLNKIPLKQSTLQRLLGVLTFFGLGRFYLRGRNTKPRKKFASNKLTSDRVRFERSRNLVDKHPHIDVGGPTIGWVFAACRAMQKVRSSGYANEISVPTLLIAAGGDSIVSPSVTENFGKRMRAGSFLTINGARHEILQERDEIREQLLAAFDAFVPGAEG